MRDVLQLEKLYCAPLAANVSLREYRSNPSALWPSRFECVRCGRSLPEHMFPIVGSTKQKGRQPAAVLFNKMCFRCHKQRRSAHIKSPLYSPELHAFSARLLSTTRVGAKNRGILFAITVEDVLGLYIAQKGRCALSDGVMQLVVGSGRKNHRAMSIDRIDSSANYTPDNVQLVCAIINIMKNDLSMEEFRLWCAAVVAHEANEDE